MQSTGFMGSLLPLTRQKENKNEIPKITKIVRTRLDNDLAPVRSILTDAGIAIPEDILARKNLRELAPSLKQAVVNYQLTRGTTT